MRAESSFAAEGLGHVDDMQPEAMGPTALGLSGTLNHDAFDRAADLMKAQRRQ